MPSNVTEPRGGSFLQSYSQAANSAFSDLSRRKVATCSGRPNRSREREVSLFSRVGLKNGNTHSRRAALKYGSRGSRGVIPLNIRLNPVRPVPRSTALLRQQPVNDPPSLGAEYRGSTDSCQEKLLGRPQNIRSRVLKASIRSGQCSGATLIVFRPRGI